MRMIDFDKKCAVKSIDLYLTIGEASWLKEELERLLRDPEADDHFHIYDEKDQNREISCSIITENKLKKLSGYNKLERQILSDFLR
ncbi:MAG: hypothetical protein JW943_06720 [Deltaproteobacteria bacterium]|nr:hypothetical protein [Deltaproteobacteria bacterium]